MDTGTRAKAIDPSDYNSPSIAIGRLVGTQTVTRRVTAVAAGRYRVAARVPGVDVDVSPSVLDFSHAGQTRTFQVTFTPDHGELRQGRDRVPDLEGRRGRAYASRWPSPRGPSRLRPGRRLGIVGPCAVQRDPRRVRDLHRRRQRVWPPATPTGSDAAGR